MILLALVSLAGCGVVVDTRSYEVHRQDFTHRLAVEGFLRARVAAKISVPESVSRAASVLWLEENGSRVEKGQIVALFDRVELERRLEAGELELRSAEIEKLRTLNESRSRVGEIVTRKDVADIELDHAQRFQRADEEIFSRREILDSELKQELARARRSQAEKLEGIATDLGETQVDLVDVRRRQASLVVERARDALDALEVRAANDGILIWSRDWQGEPLQIGEQVWRGQILGTVPDPSVLEPEVFVLEADAGAVVPGRRATITIEAYPNATYPATITWVDPVAKRAFRGSPAQYFAVKLELEETDRRVMRPGQRVRAILLLDEVEGALVVPRQALFPGEDGFVVYVDDGAETRERPVDVGALTPGHAVISAGLEPGERVTFQRPSDRPVKRGLRAALARVFPNG